MRLVFDNARRFNPAGTDVFVMAGDVEVSALILPTSPPRCRACLSLPARTLMHKASTNTCVQAIHGTLSGLNK